MTGNSTRLIFLATWFLLLLDRSTSSTNDDDDVAHLMMSFSLAAIVRKHTLPQEQRPQEYVLVHEKPPRGWWISGGGIEHIDATPVHGAIREALEEAAPQFLPQLYTLQSKSKQDAPSSSLPSMTHLISIEQTKSRIRFIFRGEWIDESDGDNSTDQESKTNQSRSLLKRPPGDEESIEARWTTWDEVQQFQRIKPNGTNITVTVPSLPYIADPWLRGHEPITFFGMLENSFQKHGTVPGLKVSTMDINEETDDVTGAYFGGLSFNSDKSNSTANLLNHGRRAALLTYLKCRLLVYDEINQTFAIDATTNVFPSSFVRDGNETLGKLVAEMIRQYVSTEPKDSKKVKEHDIAGLLRVEYVKHENGREATLTVFPFVRLRSEHKIAKDTIDWVSVEGLGDNLERRLAEAIIDDTIGKRYARLDVLAVPKKKVKKAGKTAQLTL